jgi:hypothetical protein
VAAHKTAIAMQPDVQKDLQPLNLYADFKKEKTLMP